MPKPIETTETETVVATAETAKVTEPVNVNTNTTKIKNLNGKKNVVKAEVTAKVEKQLEKGTVKATIFLNGTAPSEVFFNGQSYKILHGVPTDYPVGVLEMLKNKTEDYRPKTMDDIQRCRNSRFAVRNLGNASSPLFVFKIPQYNIALAE